MKKVIALLLIAALPVCLFAQVYRVGVDVPTTEVAIDVATDGDTLILPVEYSHMEVNLQGKDLVVGFDALEPPDEPPDSTIYGPNDPLPPTPLE